MELIKKKHKKKLFSCLISTFYISLPNQKYFQTKTAIAMKNSFYDINKLDEVRGFFVFFVFLPLLYIGIRNLCNNFLIKENGKKSQIK